MYEQLEYEHNDIPELNSEEMKSLARELYDEYRYYKESRSQLENEIWPACDRAYMCLRTLPEMQAAEFVDDSDLGETDIWDGVNFLAESMALALMPRDQTWFEPIANDAEKQPMMNQVRDYLAYLHRKADTRGQYEKHLKQVIIRGTGALYLKWTKKVRTKPLGPAKTLRNIATLSEGAVDFKTLKQMRTTEEVFSGPVIKPIDMYDLYLPPDADLTADEDVPIIFQQFMSVEDLKAARNENGEPVYSNLDGLEPMDIATIYGRDPYRWDATRTLGIDPIGTANLTSNAKYVPVYCFHRMLTRHNGKQYVDTYFYVAISANSDEPRIIRAEENPYGIRSIFIDTYHDWLNSAYGIGAVEKSLAPWEQKNVVSALTLQAQLATVFPAYNVISGMLLNDREINLGPGTLNPISLKPSVGVNFMAPVPVPENGQRLGEEAQRWLGTKIAGQLGTYGAAMDNPTRAITQAKTATQVNTESSTGSLGRDNKLERMSIRTLEPICQAFLEFAKQYAPSELAFETSTTDGYAVAKMPKESLEDVDRVIVTGFHGMVNKANEIRELNEALVAMSQAMGIPGAGSHIIGPFMDTLFKLLAKLGVQNLDKYKADPMQLILEQPDIQQQLQQMLAQAQEQGAREGAQALLEEMHGGEEKREPSPDPDAGAELQEQQPPQMGAA